VTKSVLFISNEPYSHNFFPTNRQRLALAARNAGWRVTFLETIGHRTLPKGAQIEDGIEVIHAWNILPFAAQASNRRRRTINLLLTYFRYFLTRDFNLIITFDPLAADLIEKFPNTPKHYDILDAYEFQPQYARMKDSSHLISCEAATIEACESISAVSDNLARYKASLFEKKILHLAGCHDHSLPDSEPQELKIRPIMKRAIVVSALDSYKFDPRPVRDWLDVNPDWSLTLIGKAIQTHDSDLFELIRHPRVDYLGAIAHDQISTHLAEADFGWISLSESAYSLFSFPLKVWDYLAAGLPIYTANFYCPELDFGVLRVGSEKEFNLSRHREYVNRIQSATAREIIRENHSSARFKRIVEYNATFTDS
jgi:hypothetical protein